jgi:hypothetical protein
MQTLHLRFRALRAISSGETPSRWPTPSMQGASKWETASPLPNPLRPTCAVGCRPAPRHPDGILCPVAGAGLPGVPRLRAARKNSRVPVIPYRFCRWQTARQQSPDPAPQEAGDLGTVDGQARASVVRCTSSSGLSFPLRPRPYDRRAPRSGTRASGEKTVAQFSDGSGTRCSEAPGFRPTGRLKPAPSTRVTGQGSTSSCADAPALVTGQVPGGMDMPGVSQRRCARTCLRLSRGAR